MTQASTQFEGMFAPPAVEAQRRPDGAVILRSSYRLERHPRCTGEYLHHWATHAPARPFLMERAAGGEWRGLTYRETLHEVLGVGAWLLDRKLSAEHPIVILSENSLEHAVLMLAGLHTGIPVASISPSYSLVSKDFEKLSNIVRTLSPGVVFTSDPSRFAAALAAIRGLHAGQVVVAGQGPCSRDALRFDALNLARNDAAVERAFAAVTPDTIAKFMFTSGSTDEPKGVINTQRMLCSNQEAIAQVWPFIAEPPVLLDWLPWHHTFGGNHNFNLVLRNGGTLYIDAGRPVPGQFDRTLENLRDVAPTLCFNVPRAYDLLVSALREDGALRERFFSRLRLIFYAAAALPQNLWEALETLAIETLGHKLPMVSSWGATETAPAATTCHYQADRSGVIGVPIPGCELKLVPHGNKLEARVRGPNVTPGYWKHPELTGRFFDAEGYFVTGDAVRFVDRARPERGLLFDGRLGEDFKLSTATWVHVGALRVKAIAALAPVAQDIVVTGHDRDEIGFLIFPNVQACRLLCADLPGDASLDDVLRHAKVRERVAAGLAALAEAGVGSSTFAKRALLMMEPASLDAGEITDKGYVNQRAVLLRRWALIEALYRSPTDLRVITLERPRTVRLETERANDNQPAGGTISSPNSRSSLMYESFETRALSAGYADVWLIGGVRTPFADYMSVLSAVSPTDLGIFVARAALRRSGLPPADVDSIIAGNVAQSSFDAYYLSRHIGLYAGVPLSVPALLVHRLCGTGFEAILTAADQITLGRAKLVLCVGTESMSRNPVAAYTHRSGFKLGQIDFKDFLWEAALDTASNTRMGDTAENLAKKHGITREDVDRFAAQSFARAMDAWSDGFYADEIEPVTAQSWPLEGYATRGLRLPRDVARFERDEHVRPSPLEVLQTLRPAFAKEGVQTGGNSSAIVDGAAAALVASGDYVRAHGLRPLARIVAGATVGVPPEVMGIGPVPAIRSLLKKAGLGLSNVDRFEINEAFGAQYLAVEKELALDRTRVNVHGGAIAIGHPLAASGVRLTTTVARELRQAKGEFAVSSACAGGGQGIAVLLQSAAP